MLVSKGVGEQVRARCGVLGRRPRRRVGQGGVVMVLLLRGGASLMGEVGLSMSMSTSKVLRRTVGDMNQTQPNTGNRLVQGLVQGLVCLTCSQTGSGITVWEFWFLCPLINRDVQGDVNRSADSLLPFTAGVSATFLLQRLALTTRFTPLQFRLIACPSTSTIGRYHQEFSYYYPAPGKYLAPKHFHVVAPDERMSCCSPLYPTVSTACRRGSVTSDCGAEHLSNPCSIRWCKRWI